MHDLAVFTALDWESRAVLDALGTVEPLERPRAWHGWLGDGGSCLVTQVGIGPERAGAAALDCVAARRFLTVGCAGALVPALRTGAIVVGNEVIAVDGEGRPRARLRADGTDLVAWAGTRGLRAHAGRVVSSPVVLASQASKRRLAALDALVVDMETAAVVAEAGRRGVPCLAVRVVLDELGQAVPMIGGLVDEHSGDVRIGAAVRRLAVRPHLWRAVSRLAWQQRRAEHALREFLAVVLGGAGDVWASWERPAPNLQGV